MRAKGQSDVRGGVLRWTIACLPQGALAGQLDFSPLGNVRIFSQSFEIPKQGCAAQKLSLRGAPGHLPIDVTAQVSMVKIQTLLQ